MRKVIALIAACAASIAALAAFAGVAATAASSDPDFSLSLLAENKGESVTAIPNYTDAADMASAKYKNMDLTRIPTALSATAASRSLLQAVPSSDVILGFTSSTQVIPLGSDVAKDLDGKPLLMLSSTPQFVNGAEFGADNIFEPFPVEDEVATINAEYIASMKPKVKKVGLLCVTAPFGTHSCATAKKQFEKDGVTVAAERTVGVAATDLTQQVLAFKDAGVDAVLAFAYPNPLSAFVNQMQQNGLNIPISGAQSAPYAVASNAMSPTGLANFIGSDTCIPTTLKSKRAKSWVKGYEKEYGYPPTSASAHTYDLIGFANAAIARAGTTDSSKVVSALQSQSYDGICGTYKADKGNGLYHQLSIVGYKGGTPKVLKSYTTGVLTPEETTTTTAPAATPSS